MVLALQRVFYTLVNYLSRLNKIHLNLNMYQINLPFICIVESHFYFHLIVSIVLVKLSNIRVNKLVNWFANW